MSPNSTRKPQPPVTSTRWRDGMMPKELPSRGEELMPGYQYELDPAARRAIFELYGLAGVPTYVECIKKRCAPCKRVSITTNLETNEEFRHEVTEPEQQATFRAYLGGKRLAVFSLDLPALIERRAALTPADLVKDDDYSRSDERPESRKGAKAKPTRLDVSRLFDNI